MELNIPVHWRRNTLSQLARSTAERNIKNISAQFYIFKIGACKIVKLQTEEISLLAPCLKLLSRVESGDQKQHCLRRYTNVRGSRNFMPEWL
jgi:hypothetical protein